MTGKRRATAQDRLDDRLADLGLQVVELRRVVPGHARPVVAVVDEAVLAGRAVLPPKDHRRVRVVVVVVLDPDADAGIRREVRPAKRVRRVGGLVERDEPVRMLHDPGRIDPHVVGDHVAGEPDAAPPGTLAQVLVRRFAAQVLSDPVVEQGVGRGHGVRIAAQLLDPLRRPAALPQADQPEPGEAPARQTIELLIRHLVEAAHLALVLLRQLVEPDVGAPREQDQPRHPVAVHAEPLGLEVLAREVGHVPAADVARAVEAQPEGPFVLAQDVQREGKAAPESFLPAGGPSARGCSAAGRAASRARRGPGCGASRPGPGSRARRAAARRRTRRARRSCPRTPSRAQAARRRTAPRKGANAGLTLASQRCASSSSATSRLGCPSVVPASQVRASTSPRYTAAGG